MRMTIEQVQAGRARTNENAKAEAMAAEEAAVYNLDLIRKLEKRVARLESEVLAHAKSITTLDRMLTATCHKPEGPDPTRESEGAWGYE